MKIEITLPPKLENNIAVDNYLQEWKNFIEKEKLKRIKLERKEKLIKMTYTEYIAENLDKSIDYTKYIAENVGNSINYSEYLAENLDKTIDYSEYLTEHLGKTKSQLIRENRVAKLNKINMLNE